MEADVVYILRAVLPNAGQELRHSLRSLRNLPHRRVWVVSTRRPKFLGDEVGFIPVKENGVKWRNLPLATLAACAHEEVGERFVLMNDDFFVMEPIAEMPLLHRGPVSEHPLYATSSHVWVRGIRETETILRSWGHTEPLNYELHCPLPASKALMRCALEGGLHGFKGTCLQTRTLYGNAWRLGGERSGDMKVYGPADLPGPFVSTNEASFIRYAVGKRIRRTFPDPSPYER